VVKVYNSIVRGGYTNGSNIFNFDPYFINPTEGNFAPAFCSPVIDAGNKDSLPSNLLIDMRSNARVYNGQVDLGAIEFQGFNKSYTIDSTNPALKYIFYNGTTEGVSYRWLRCDNNYAEIPGATSSSLPVTESGVYALEVAQFVTGASISYGCYDTLDCISIQYSTVGVNNLISGDGRCNVYPNPTRSMLSIESNEEIQSIQVADVTGRIIISQTNPAARNLQLATEMLDEATYFIHIKTTSGKTAVKSFVKQ
jgi:hypothetical protein